MGQGRTVSLTNGNTHKAKAQNRNSIPYSTSVRKKELLYTYWVGFPVLTGYFYNSSLVAEDPILLHSDNKLPSSMRLLSTANRPIWKLT